MRWQLFLPLVFSMVLPGAVARAATLPDMLGRPVTVPQGPPRLVSLAPSLTEIVFALDRGDWLVGVTEFCDYPPAARSKPRVGGPMTPNLERVVQVRPSLVLATAEGNPRETMASLTGLGIPVFAVKPEGYAGVLASILTLGKLLHAEREAGALVRDIEMRVAAIGRAVARRPRPKVLYLVWADPLIAAGPGSFIHDLIQMAGGENVVRERAVPYPKLSWEEAVAQGPEVILVASHQQGEERAPRMVWHAWQSVPAVRSSRVVPVPGDLVHRPGPRVAEGLELLARAIHPGAFLPGGPR